jgi:hypothetical protein
MGLDDGEFTSLMFITSSIQLVPQYERKDFLIKKSLELQKESKPQGFVFASWSMFFLARSFE